ncbi:MAG: hypothetical protein HC912_12585 [Saprospiraceae bacterium]|nr:hypothetical protein [Saprospiraceae bacterium]
MGETALEQAALLQAQFLPNKVVMATVDNNNEYPLLVGKAVTSETLIYVCKDYACQQPLTSVAAVLEGMKT